MPFNRDCVFDEVTGKGGAARGLVEPNVILLFSWSANQFVVPQTTPVASTCAVGPCNRDAGNTGSDMDHQIVPGLQLPSHHL